MAGNRSLKKWSAPSPASSMLWLGGDVKEPTRKEKSRAWSSRCCGLAFVVILRVGVEMLGDISYDEATLEIRGKIKYSLHFTSLHYQKPTTKRFVLIIEGDVLEAEENKSTQRKIQTDVASVMTFLVNCSNRKSEEIRGKIKSSLHFTSLHYPQKPTTKRFVLIIESDVLEAEENKTTQRKIQTDVASVMTFLVNCSNSGEQNQKQPTLTASCFQHSEFERNVSLLSIITCDCLWLYSWTLLLNF